MTHALVLPEELQRRIMHEARAAFPRECCGLLEGSFESDRVRVDALHPARNIAADDDRFEIDPADHFAALRSARAAEHQIVGCYHSHPHGKTEPSERDAEFAKDENFLWIIAAVSKAGFELSGFIRLGEKFVSLELKM